MLPWDASQLWLWEIWKPSKFLPCAPLARSLGRRFGRSSLPCWMPQGRQNALEFVEPCNRFCFGLDSWGHLLSQELAFLIALSWRTQIDLICKGSGISRRSGQDAGERSFGYGRGPWARILQMTFLGSESIRRLGASNRPFEPQQLSPSPNWGWRPYPQSWGHQEGWRDVLHWPEGCLSRNSLHLDSQPYIYIALNEEVFQSKAHCFLLSITLQLFSLVKVCSQERDLDALLSRALDDWLIIMESVAYLQKHHELLH